MDGGSSRARQTEEPFGTGPAREGIEEDPAQAPFPAIFGRLTFVKFLVDECLHTTLVAVAQDHGHECFHVNRLVSSSSLPGCRSGLPPESARLFDAVQAFLDCLHEFWHSLSFIDHSAFKTSDRVDGIRTRGTQGRPPRHSG